MYLTYHVHLVGIKRRNWLQESMELKASKYKISLFIMEEFFLHIIIQQALSQEENPVLKYSRLYTLHMKWYVKCAMYNVQ